MTGPGAADRSRGATRSSHEVRAALEPLMPGLGRMFDDAESAVVHGGFVFARGTGSLDDPRSGLHRRDRYGVQRRGLLLLGRHGQVLDRTMARPRARDRDRRLMGESGSADAQAWNPRVTALVPTYNGAEFIMRTLDSLAAQTWSNLEILIGDDRSTDDTLEVVRRFAEASPGHARPGARRQPGLAAQLE